MSSRAFYPIAALLLVLSACPAPQPPTTTVEDTGEAGDYPGPPEWTVVELPEGSAQGLASPCGKACVNLKKIGCREGGPTKAGVSCYRGCLSMAKQQRVPTACWAGAKSAESVRSCGGIRCLD